MPVRMNRRGFSLIQLTLLMPALMVMFLVTVAWLHQTMTFSSNMKKQQVQHLSLTRLAFQFRQDVQRCKSISMISDQQICLQNQDLSEITYTINEHAVNFFKRSSDGRRTQQEQFALASGSSPRFDDTELPDWISLIVSRPPVNRRQQVQQKLQSNETAITELHVRSKPNRWGTNLSPDAELPQGEQQ